MNRLLWVMILGVVVLAPLAWADATHIPAGPVSGEWTEQGNPYVIEGDVVIPEGQTLTIAAKVNVYFSGHYKFTVNGTLEAVAAEKKGLLQHFMRKEDGYSIHFTSDPSTNPTGWGGIRFVHASKDCALGNCVIEHGQATGEGADGMGGAIYVEDSSPDIANCLIRDNSATGSGGGIAFVNSKVDVANCSVANNSAGKMGGGVFVSGGTVDLANISISKNTGGGLACVSGAKVSVANCEISGNKGVERGGGIYANGASVDVANASISGNENGGAAFLSGSKADFANCSIENNHGSVHGGGIYCNGSSLDMVNAAVSSNEAGGLYFEEKSEASLTNCAVSGNHGGKNLEHDAASTVSTQNSSVKD